MVTTGMSILYPKVRLQNEERHLSFHCLDEIPPNAPYPFLSLCLGNINGCSYLKIFLHSMLSLEMGFWHLNKPQEMMEVYLSKEHRTQPLHFLVSTWASYGKWPENMKCLPAFFTDSICGTAVTWERRGPASHGGWPPAAAGELLFKQTSTVSKCKPLCYLQQE